MAASKKTHIIMVTDLMTDQHLLITRKDIGLIKSALLSLQRDFYEMEAPEIEREVMDLWHKFNDWTKGGNDVYLN